MAIVFDFMSQRLYAVSPEMSARDAAEDIMRRGITAAPVVDRSGYPLGMLSLRDIFAKQSDAIAQDCMHSPAVVIESSESIAAAARIITHTGLHRLIVVDELGRAVGILSAMDIVRALSGAPHDHPWPFPYEGEAPTWTPDRPLELAAIDTLAPDGPGVFALVTGGENAPETVKWAESCKNVRARLRAVVVGDQQEAPLNHIIARTGIRFRTLASPLRAARQQALHDYGK